MWVSYYKNAEVCLVKEYVRFVTREGMKRGYVYAPTYIKDGAEIINSACEWLKGIECLASCSSANLEGFYSRRAVGNVKILHGDMDIVMIVYSFPTNMDSCLLSNSVKCRCGEFVNDAKIKVLEKCMNSTKPELNCMCPEYLCARRKQYNSHTRELFIQIGLRRDIESLKEKYSVVAI